MSKVFNYFDELDELDGDDGFDEPIEETIDDSEIMEMDDDGLEDYLLGKLHVGEPEYLGDE